MAWQLATGSPGNSERRVARPAAVILVAAVWAAAGTGFQLVAGTPGIFGPPFADREAPFAAYDQPGGGDELTSSARPSPRGYHAMTYDAGADRVIVFGGQSSTAGGVPDLADTWAYDASAKVWTEKTPTPSPPAGALTMVYDSRAGAVVILKGNPNGRLETWAYSHAANEWILKQPNPAPAPRNGWRISYDSQSDRVVFFGGVLSGVRTNDTWAYDFGNDSWQQMAPSVSPPARNWHRLVYEPQWDRILLFGGSVNDNAVWAYDYDTDTWNSLGSLGAPPPRIYHDMVYDDELRRVILFGGVDYPSEQPRADTWTYDFGTRTWMQLTTSGAPSPRGWHGMAYDASLRRTVLFGGGPNRVSFTRETWSYDSTASAWTLVNGPTPPTPIFNYSPLSPVGGQIVTFDASSSADADGSIISFSWSFGDGAGAFGATVQHEYAAGRTYEVTLTVTDDDRLANSTTEQVVVAPAPDTTDPSIAITSPSNGATLTALTVAITGTASDNVGLSRVELSADGTNWLLAAGTTFWSATLTLTEGPNTIHARAVDTSGNMETTNVAVTVVLPSSPPPPTPYLILIGLTAGIVATAIGVGFLLLRRRRAP